MRLETIVEYVELCLSFVLVIRLFSLKLGRVYSIFAAYLVTDFLGSLAAALYDFRLFSLDYRIVYSVNRVLAWTFSLWVIYSLLNAMLQNLPGILRYSKRLLNITFALAALVGGLVVTFNKDIASAEDWRALLDRVVAITLVIDLTVAVTILLVLAVMLTFFLWFPVVTSRNLAVFSVGYCVYFSAVTVSLLVHTFRPPGSSPVGSIVLMLVTSLCYAYWAIFLSKAGESIPVRIGHSWKTDEQHRLMNRLEQVNGVLLQTLANKR